MACGWIVLAALICMMKAPESSAQGVEECDTFEDFPDTSAENNDICVVSGDPHFKTFDSLRFDFQGNCNYTLLRINSYEVMKQIDIVGEFQQMKHHQRKSVIKRVFVSTMLGTLILDSNLNVFRREFFRRPVQVTRKYALLYNMEVDVFIYCNAVIINLMGYDAKLYWRKPHTVLVQAGPRFSSVESFGLCGNYNGDKTDDVMTRDGQLETDVALFGHSWRTEQETGSYQNWHNDSNCEVCKNCVSKPLCQTNPQYAEEAKERCSIFSGDLPSCPFQLRDREISSPDDWNSECNSVLCLELPDSFYSFCQLYKNYGEACDQVGSDTLPGWIMPEICYDILKPQFQALSPDHWL